MEFKINHEYELNALWAKHNFCGIRLVLLSVHLAAGNFDDEGKAGEYCGRIEGL